ncbi:MAG: hypothetical protein RIC35_22390 [Marinoscillum sp.]
MRLKNQLSLVLYFTIFMVSAQTQMDRVKVNKYISMKIPTTLTPMSQQEMISRYVSAKPPIAMYTYQNQQIDLGINETSNQWQGGELEIIKSFYKASIANLFTEVQFLQENIQQIGGRDFIVFEFVSRVTDEDNTFGNGSSISKYTYIVYTLFQDRVMLFNFTCPARFRHEWEATAKEMMESIRINL